ncbi:C-type lectin galactose-binding isoform [Nymphon striatum]|nr:C-type lectin galactose-binding isoform [Nymphon striatum]
MLLSLYIYNLRRIPSLSNRVSSNLPSNSNLKQRLVPTTTPTPRTCPQNMTAIGKSCYMIGKDKLSWDDAEESCLNLGSHLVSILSFDEMEEVNSKFTINNGSWIGLSDFTDTTPWQWSSGWHVDFTNWAMDEPRAGHVESRCAAINEDGLRFCSKHRILPPRFYISLLPFNSRAECHINFLFHLQGRYMDWIVGIYKWEDNSAVDFFNWKSGEPKKMLEKTCVEMERSSLEWVASRCFYRRNVICAANKIGITFTSKHSSTMYLNRTLCKTTSHVVSFCAKLHIPQLPLDLAKAIFIITSSPCWPMVATFGYSKFLNQFVALSILLSLPIQGDPTRRIRIRRYSLMESQQRVATATPR